jgi:hypothetical protein
VVEYNVDQGNMWVPHPFSYPRFEILAKKAGLQKPELISTIASSFLTEMYCAQASLR